MSRVREFYDSVFLEKQLCYYQSLPEKQRRHFLAMEFERLGVGSKRYLCRVFGCDHRTLNKGLFELQSVGYQVDYSRQRRAGGGRKKRACPTRVKFFDIGLRWSAPCWQPY